MESKTIYIKSNERKSRNWKGKWDNNFKIIIAVVIAVVAALIVLGTVHYANKKVTLKLNGESKVTLEPNSSYNDKGAVALVGSKDISGSIKTDNPVNTKKSGTYKVVYSVKRLWKTTSISRTVFVKDESAPSVKLNGASVIKMNQGDEFKDPGVTATDNEDGDISSKVVRTGRFDRFRQGTYKVTYTATDKSGNKTSVSRKIIVNYINRKGKSVIYLTFDDGPSKNNPPKILDTLKKYKVKATFYIVDYKKDDIPLLKRMLKEGHNIGIHGYSHEYLYIYQDLSHAWNNIVKLREKLYKDTGYMSYMTRFPGGSSNTISKKARKGVMTALCQKVEDEGMFYMDWNVTSGDAVSGTVTPKMLYNNVKAQLIKKKNNVILFHDSAPKESTAKALPSIIEYGKKEGYTFQTITKDTPPVHQAVAN